MLTDTPTHRARSSCELSVSTQPIERRSSTALDPLPEAVMVTVPFTLPLLTVTTVPVTLTVQLADLKEFSIEVVSAAGWYPGYEMFTAYR